MALEDNKKEGRGSGTEDPKKRADKTLVDPKAGFSEPPPIPPARTDAQDQSPPTRSHTPTEGPKKTDTDLNTVLAGSAGVVAGGIAGVAAGTIYSEEIKENLSDLSESLNLGSTGIGEETSPNSEQAEPEPEKPTPPPPDPLPEVITEPPAEPDSITLSIDDVEGNTFSVELMDFDNDQVADEIALSINDLTFFSGTPEDLQSLFEPAQPEEYPDSNLEGSVSFGDTEAVYAPIDWQDYLTEDEPLDPIEIENIDDGDLFGQSGTDIMPDGETVDAIMEESHLNSLGYEHGEYVQVEEIFYDNDEYPTDPYLAELENTDFSAMDIPAQYLETDFGESDPSIYPGLLDSIF